MASRSSIIRVSVIGDTKGLAGPLKQAENSISGLSKASSKAQGFLKGSAKAMGVGLLAAGAAAAKFGADSVRAASDAQQSLGATESIFGKFADTVERTSGRAANKYGLSAHQYRESANLLGALFKNQGVSMDQLAGKTEQLVGRGADLAAMYGGTAADAVDALTAAYKGEFDSLDKYGISINAAKIQTELAAKGQDKLTGAQLDAAKQAATTRLIMQQSADAAGSFGRESNTLAGQQQRLSAQFENVKAKIGTALLPVLTQLMGTIAKEGIPILERFGTWFQAEGPAAIEKVTGAIQTVLPIIASLGTFLLDNAKTIAILVGGFYAITTAIAIINPLISAAMGLWKAYKAVMTALKVAQVAFNIVLMANPIGLVIAAIVALVAIFVIAYKKSETFRNVINSSWEAIKNATKAVWEWIKDKIKGVFDFLKNLFLNFTGPGLIIKHWDTIKNKTREAWEWVKDKISGVWEAIKTNISTAGARAKELLSNAWEAVKTKTREAWDALKGIIRDKIENFMENVRGIKDKVTGALSGIASWLRQAGKDLIQGLINGVKDMAGNLVDAAKGVVDGAIKAAKNLLGLGSPSRLFKQYGEWTAEGLVIGLKKKGGEAARAAAGLSKKVAEGFEAPKMTLSARPALATSGAAGGAGNTYQITVQAPVGSNGADIGRTLIKYIEDYERVGGRRRA